MNGQTAIAGRDGLVKMSMAFADAVVPESLRPIEIRSCVSPAEDRSVNFTCFKLLVAMAFQHGYVFASETRLPVPQQIACAALDYVEVHHGRAKKSRAEFMKNCFIEGAATFKRMNIYGEKCGDSAREG